MVANANTYEIKRLRDVDSDCLIVVYCTKETLSEGSGSLLLYVTFYNYDCFAVPTGCPSSACRGASGCKSATSCRKGLEAFNILAPKAVMKVEFVKVIGVKEGGKR
jgi:hypothetical protein